MILVLFYLFVQSKRYTGRGRVRECAIFTFIISYQQIRIAHRNGQNRIETVQKCAILHIKIVFDIISAHVSLDIVSGVHHNSQAPSVVQKNWLKYHWGPPKKSLVPVQWPQHIFFQFFFFLGGGGKGITYIFEREKKCKKGKTCFQSARIYSPDHSTGNRHFVKSLGGLAVPATVH